MRESNRLKRTHLPADVYEEWVKSQPVKPVGAGRPRKPSENQYEEWVEKRVKKRIARTRQTVT
jgi:hypothetical protein